jgi:hypothetical protein
MKLRHILALIAAAALVAPAAASAAPAGPPIPETITLPTKIVKGESAIGTVCLDRAAESPTEVTINSSNTFLVETQPSVTIAAGEQCASFTVTSFDRFETTESVNISAFANGDFAQRVLYVIPRAGVDLVEVTKADVNRNFTKVTITATSDELGAILTAFAGGIELGVLEQKGDRYVGRFDLTQPINNVEVMSSLGGCAQRAVPFGNNSVHC